MRKYLTAVLFLLLALPAQAATPSHTLYAYAGDAALALEAPEGMCFLDRSYAEQNGLYKVFSDSVRKEGGQMLLAVFMECGDLNTSIENVMQGVLPSAGIVTWMNPMIGEATDMKRQDYLDMREASYAQYMGNRTYGLALDNALHRTINGVALGMTGRATTGEGNSGPMVSAVRGTTLLGRTPVEVTFRYTGAAPPPLDKVYPMVDKFMARQIALNN